MTAFQHDETASSRLDYTLLRDGGISLYYSEEILGEDLDWMRDQHYLVHEFDCTTWRTEDIFHTQVAETFGFPSYYGRNPAAFNDCMRDVEVPNEGGMILLFRGVDSITLRGGKFFPIVLDILAGMCRANLLFGRRLLVLLHSRNPSIEFEPVGAVPVMWNPREWLNSK